MQRKGKAVTKRTTCITQRKSCNEKEKSCDEKAERQQTGRLVLGHKFTRIFARKHARIVLDEMLDRTAEYMQKEC